MDQFIDHSDLEQLLILNEELREVLEEELNEFGEKSLFFDGNDLFFE